MFAPDEWIPLPHGTLRSAKIGELRLETGNLGIPVWVLRLPFVATPIYGGFAYLVFPRCVFVGNVRTPPGSHCPRPPICCGKVMRR